MNKLLTLLIFLVLNSGIVAQDVIFPTKSDYPLLPKYGKNINDFVPRNWKVFGKALGDLNGDGKVDCALVIKADYAKFINRNNGVGFDQFNTNPRILVILFKDKNGFKVAKQSNTFIIVPDSPAMSEPFQSAKISNGILQLNFELWYSAGSWSAYEHSYKFRFRNNEFVLIGVDKTTSVRNSGETESRSYNFLTKKIKITTGNYTSDEKKKVRWKIYSLKKLKTIDTFREPFNWEIEYDYYI